MLMYIKMWASVRTRRSELRLAAVGVQERHHGVRVQQAVQQQLREGGLARLLAAAHQERGRPLLLLVLPAGGQLRGEAAPLRRYAEARRGACSNSGPTIDAPTIGESV